MNGAHISCFGNLTRDPEKRFSQNNGTEYARITVAVNTVTGPDRRDTEFFTANLYENQMQRAMARCAKGTPVYLSGRFSHREYQRQDGSKGCDLHIETRDFRILHRAPEGYWDQALPEQPETPETDIEDIDFHDTPDTALPLEAPAA